MEFEPVEGAAEVVGTGVSVRFRGVKDVFTDKEKIVDHTVSLKELDASQPNHILIQEIQYNAYKQALILVKKSKSKPYQIQVIKNLISGEGGLNLLNMGLIQSLYSILELIEAVPKDEKALSFALGAALSARYNPAEWSLAKQSAQNMALELSARHKFEVVSSPEAQELVTKNPTRYIFRTSSMGDEFIGLTQMNFSDAEPPFQPERFTFKIEAPDKIVPYINGVEAGIKYTSLDDLISDIEFRQTLIDIYHSRDDVVKQRELTEQLRKINPEAEINLIREAILDADHDKLLATLKTTLKVGDQHRGKEREERIAREEAVARRAPRRP